LQQALLSRVKCRQLLPWHKKTFGPTWYVAAVLLLNKRFNFNLRRNLTAGCQAGKKRRNIERAKFRLKFNSGAFQGANSIFGPETAFDPQSKPTTPRKRGKKRAQIDAKMTKTTHFEPKRQKKMRFCTIFFALSTDLIEPLPQSSQTPSVSKEVPPTCPP